MTPFTRLCRAGAAVACLGLIGATGARAVDLNPFHFGAPPQTAQATLPPAAVPGGPTNSDDAGAFDVRIDRLENELRQANGRIEELENQQRRLEDQLKRFQQDVEFRLGGAGPVPAPGPATAPPVVAAAPPVAAAVPPVAAADISSPLKTARKGDAFDPTVNPGAVGAPRPLGTTPPSAPLAQPISPTGAPLDLSGRPISRPRPRPCRPAPSSPTRGRRSSPAAASASPTARASNLTRRSRPIATANTPQAEEQLKAFLAANGSHRLAPDAIFYLGETYFQRSRPREAAEQYLKLSTDFAKSARAPEGMLRLGQSLAALGSNDQACATSPKSANAIPPPRRR